MRVGLTGGVASGKSTVAAYLSEMGAVIVDSDQLAREVVTRGTPGLAQVVAAFGPGVLTAEGDLNRPLMGSIVFKDPAARKRLEAIIHPLVAARSAELVAAAGDAALVVQDIPLLVEGGMAANFDEIIVVDVPEEVQVERMVRDRGWTETDARARMAAQATREQRCAVATFIIDNTGTREELRARVAETYAALLARQQELGG